MQLTSERAEGWLSAGRGALKTHWASVGRAGWTIFDQVVSSLTNAGLSILIARSVTTDTFGAFAVAFSLYTFLVGTSRALCLQALTVRFAGAGSADFSGAARAALGGALAFGFGCAAGVAVAGLAIGGAVGLALLATAVALPGLLLQDAARAVFFTQGRPHRAAAVDVAWSALQFSSIGLLLHVGVDTATPLVLSWGLSAATAALLSAGLAHLWPALTQAGPWIRRHWDLSGYFVAEWLCVVGAVQVSILLIGVIAGVGEVGSLRAAQVLLGPLNIIAFGVWSFAQPELVRRGQMTARSLTRAAAMLSGGLIAADLLWGGLLLIVPESVGVRLLGSSWAGAHDVLPAMVLLTVLASIQVGPLIVIRCLGRARESFWISVLMAIMILSGSFSGLLLGGVQGAALGLALGHGLVAPLFYRLMKRALAEDGDGAGAMSLRVVAPD